MRIYTVQQGPDPRSAGDDIEFVREGFSWGAFFFTLAWPLYHGLWLVFVIILVSSAVLSGVMAFAGFDGLGRGAVWLAASLLFGYEANNLRRWTLQRRGWRQVGIASGRALADAEHRFFGIYAVSSSGMLIPRTDAPV